MMRSATRSIVRHGAICGAVVVASLGIATSLTRATDDADQMTSAASQPSTTQASSRPTSAPNGDFDVYDWVIMVADPAEPRANLTSLIKSSLPSSIDTRRTAGPATQQSTTPQPLGIIRIIGRSPDSKVDVKIDTPDGRMLTTWPKARNRSGSLIWHDLVPATQPTRLPPMPADHWFNALRAESSNANPANDAAFLNSEDLGSERFLLYDVEIKFTVPIQLDGGRHADAAISMANSGTTAMRDLTFYRPDAAGGWQVAEMSDVVPARKLAPATTQAATSQPAASQPATTQSTSQPTTQPSSQPATSPTTTSATAPSTQPFAGLDERDVVRVHLQHVSTTQPTEVLAAWKDRLIKAGLPPSDPDIELIVKTLATNALDSKHLSAVYRLDDAELDRMLPLEVLPLPRRTVRVGLVIVRNIDPAVPAEIDELIAQLGDRSWANREIATKTLTAIGATARVKLQAAVNSPDAEIALRAERILGTIITK